jgi:hypothetical protein
MTQLTIDFNNPNTNTICQSQGPALIKFINNGQSYTLLQFFLARKAADIFNTESQQTTNDSISDFLQIAALLT